MSANRPNIPTWSTTDIQKYLNGEMSAREMHDLEKAALDDPFLADALEGMEKHAALTAAAPSAPPDPTTAFARDLADLHTRLETRIAQKERPPALPFFRSGWKIAAVLILLLGLGLTAYYTLLKQEHAAAPLATTAAPATTAPAKTTAPDRTAAPEPPSPTSQTPTAKAYLSTDSAIATTTAPPSGNASLYRSAPGRKNRALANTDLAKTQVPDSVAVAFADHSPAPGLSVTTLTRKDTLSNAAGYKRVFANASGQDILSDKKTLAAQNFFSGKVVDANNNNPLSGASLHLVGRNINTVTDKNGLFSLRLPGNDSVANLNVASVGYQQANLSLSQDNRTGNLIQLQPQTSALNEVVVIGYGTKRKETIRHDTAEHESREMAIQKDMENLKAVPVMGWNDYNHYLDAHKPTTGLDSTLKGDETIVFRIHSKGILSDFHIERSLSPAHDTAVIRLVQQGPAWKLNGRKKAWARVTVSF